MTISLKITDSIGNIEKNINTAIASYINDKLSNSTNNIIKDISAYIPNWIRDQPEIVSLMSKDNSSLAGHFGIAGDSGSIVEAIISSVVGSLSFKFIKYNNTLSKGGFNIYIQPDDFINLLELQIGHTFYRPTHPTFSNGDLHWMDWLLIKGDSIIISNYHYNPSTGLGRSGLGNMTTGGAWRVPPQFSGTVSNNFVTRALSGNDKDNIITNIFNKHLG